MKSELIKPVATALWLIKNTKLTFKQIADFCSISEAEVEDMANGFGKAFLEPNNPVKLGQLKLDDIKKCELDNSASLPLQGVNIFNNVEIKLSKKVFTPISKRREKLNAALWLAQNTQLTSLQIVKLTGVRKQIVESIMEGSYQKVDEITPKDPVNIGVCTQIQLNEELEKVKKVDK